MTIGIQTVPKYQAPYREEGNFQFIVYFKSKKYCFQSLRMIGILCGFASVLSYFDTIHWQGDYLVKRNEGFIQ